MTRLPYLARRLAFAIFLVLVVSSVAMLLTRLAPGDAVDAAVGEPGAGTHANEERNQLGLNRGLAESYVDWLRAVVRFDFGKSSRYNAPVGPMVRAAAGNTALLAICALLTATLIGLPLGVANASVQRSWGRGLRLISLGALSFPPFVTSLLLIWVAARTGWLPVGGMTDDLAMERGIDRVIDVARHLVVPVIALAIPLTATFERLQGRAMREALTEPWIAAARARGVPEGRLRWRHALRRALLPVAALYGLVAGALLSGSFAVEVVTSWPGLGRLMHDALLARDVNLVAACAATGAVFVAAGTLASDVATAWLDPRIGDRP